VYTLFIYCTRIFSEHEFFKNCNVLRDKQKNVHPQHVFSTHFCMTMSLEFNDLMGYGIDNCATDLDHN
jgi:hypothetical protein